MEKKLRFKVKAFVAHIRCLVALKTQQSEIFIHNLVFCWFQSYIVTGK